MITTKLETFDHRFEANRQLLRLRNALTEMQLSYWFDLSISYDAETRKYTLNKLDYSK